MCWCCPTATPRRRWPESSATVSGSPRSPSSYATRWLYEDDAEDAQWLVVVEDPAARLDSAVLDAFAAEYDGWLEAP